MVDYIAPDTEMEGKLLLSGPLEIQGKFTGSIESRSEVEVSKQAEVRGSMDAACFRIRGRIHGTVQGRQTLEILDGARFHARLENQPEKIILSPRISYEDLAEKP